MDLFKVENRQNECNNTAELNSLYRISDSQGSKNPKALTYLYSQMSDQKKCSACLKSLMLTIEGYAASKSGALHYTKKPPQQQG